METESGHEDAALAQQLVEQAKRFDFYQAVRLLERLRPGCAPLGEGTEPEREAVRIRGAMKAAGASRAVEEIVLGVGERPASLTSSVLELAGEGGPLPEPFRALLAERDGDLDFALRDFLDIFNHRLASLAFRIRAATRVGLGRGAPEDHPAASIARALAGTSGVPAGEEHAWASDGLAAYARGLAAGARSAADLEAVLSAYLGSHVEVRAATGCWYDVDEAQQAQLGAESEGACLGGGAVLGGRYWDQAGAFDVVVGPVQRDLLADILPGGPAFRALCAIARQLAGPSSTFRVEIAVRPGAAPPSRLASAGAESPHRPRLGWNAWLASPDGSGFREPARISSEVTGRS